MRVLPFFRCFLTGCLVCVDGFLDFDCLLVLSCMYLSRSHLVVQRGVMRTFRRRFSILTPPSGDLDTWAENPSGRSEGELGSGNPSDRFVVPRGPQGVMRARNRIDQPVVRVSGHADPSAAMESASNKVNKIKAIDALNTAMYAASSQAPQQALLRTWERFHLAWFGSSIPVYPITIGSLKAVSAMFKCGQYTSFRNYVYAAKSNHMRLGFPWHQQLDRCTKDCLRSVLRGLGPSKRSDPLIMDRALSAAATLTNNMHDLTKPFDTKALLATAVFFMCREIEVAGALQHELVVEGDGGSCTLLLPASKKDSMANGTSRTTVECWCDLGVFCLPHYLQDYQRRLASLAQELGKDSDEMPLFPNPLGSVLTKSQIVSVIRNVVKDYMPGISDEAISRYSGHTFRITGARWYSDLGLDPLTIAIHGRWTSSAVMSYLAEAPLLSMKARLRPIAPKGRLHEMNSCKRSFDMMEPKDDRLRCRILTVQRHADEFEEQDTAQEVPAEEVQHRGFVLNTVSSRVHIQKETVDEQTHSWATLCGWKWAGKRHVHSARVSPDFVSSSWKKCPKCFREEINREEQLFLIFVRFHSLAESKLV